jgi:hypothetical protein
MFLSELKKVIYFSSHPVVIKIRKSRFFVSLRILKGKVSVWIFKLYQNLYRVAINPML